MGFNSRFKGLILFLKIDVRKKLLLTSKILLTFLPSAPNPLCSVEIASY
jgi:hypothetical protein